jgi:pimeloyl-ACP methyl ester carboxylesterase
MIMAELTKSVKKTVNVEGGVLAYEVAGTGPAVLCLPSLGDTRREYERLTPALVEAGYQVITTDLRGMGESRGKFRSHNLRDLTNDIKTILDAEKVTEAHLVACSVSGASAGLFAVENPARVKSLIMFNPIMHTGSRLTTALMVTALRTPGLGRQIWSSYFKSLYPSRPVEPEYLAQVVAETRKPGAMKSIADMCATPRIDREISQIKVPALIFFGSKDPDFKNAAQEAELVQREIPQAQVNVLEGLGHYPQREKPEAVLPQVLECLKARG